MKSVFVVFLFVFLVGLGSGAEDMTLSPFDVSVSVRGSPFISIVSPIAGTYFSNSSLRLIVEHNADSLWYNLDGGSNITFSGFGYINVPNGSHTINVFGNNSFGESVKNVSFDIDLGSYLIIYDEFRGIDRGDSIDFDSFSYEQIQSLSGIVLEKIGDGRIEFDGVINVTADGNSEDSITNIDSFVHISQNHIELNPNGLPNFNVSAKLELYGLDFDNPRILRDGSVCGDCVKNYFAGGNLSFNVSGFSTYSAEETLNNGDGSDDSENSGEGGGSDGENSNGNLFDVSKSQIDISLKQGERKNESVEIRNADNKKLNFKLSSDISGDMIRFSETSFSLNPDEVKIINIEFIALEDKEPDLYLGEILVNSDGDTKKILVSFEIESEEILFDVKIDILDKYLKVRPGEDLFATIIILNLGAEGEVDTNVTYHIRDEEDNLILESQELVNVGSQSSLSKKFRIPGDAKLGKHVLYVSVEYDGKIGSASQWFEVVEGKTVLELWISVLVILIIVILIIIFGKKNNIKRKSNKRVKHVTNRS